MRVVDDYPPNFRDIASAIPAVADSKPIYCYGDAIYNPHGREITADLQMHEQVHSKQQGDSPETWWLRYLSDPAFRLSQELEAYGVQYTVVRPLLRGQMRQWALESMAKALSGATYGSLISHGEAVSKIRNYQLPV